MQRCRGGAGLGRTELWRSVTRSCPESDTYKCRKGHRTLLQQMRIQHFGESQSILVAAIAAQPHGISEASLRDQLHVPACAFQTSLHILSAARTKHLIQDPTSYTTCFRRCIDSRIQEYIALRGLFDHSVSRVALRMRRCRQCIWPLGGFQRRFLRASQQPTASAPDNKPTQSYSLLRLHLLWVSKLA